jgi:PAP2 superfamily protein
MQSILNRVLLAITTAIVLLDGIWLVAGRFAFDAHNYGLLFLLMLPLAAGSAYYGLLRRDVGLSAVLACSAYLVVFSAGASLLSYLLVAIAGPRIDTLLAHADQAIGFDWPTVMGIVARHPGANLVLKAAYVSVMPQTMVLLLALGWSQKIDELYRLSLALSTGAIITLTVWAMTPSFGAFSVFTLPDAVAGKLGLVLGFDYGRALVQLLKDGPGFISPTELRGIVGFPSYHTLQALVLAWYARKIAIFRWPAIILNIVVLVSIPVQGGHHLMDMFGGAAVTVLAVALAGWIVSAAAKRAAVISQRDVAMPEAVRAGDQPEIAYARK